MIQLETFKADKLKNRYLEDIFLVLEKKTKNSGEKYGFFIKLVCT